MQKTGTGSGLRSARLKSSKQSGGPQCYTRARQNRPYNFDPNQVAALNEGKEGLCGNAKEEGSHKRTSSSSS